MSRDVVAEALQRPIEWRKLEKVAVEVLAQDDMPNLRLIGGSGDGGVDGEEVSFYRSKTQTHRLVQITSEKTQLSKLKRTITRLRESQGATFQTLVMVYRGPVGRSVALKLREEAAAENVALDVRDEEYLVAQLARPTGIFQRHFGSYEEQLRKLLNDAEPLALSSEPLKKAVLASLAAYSLNPEAQLARTTLFDRTLLAVLSSQGSSSPEALSLALRKILPEPIAAGQLGAALSRLLKKKKIREEAGSYRLTERESAEIAEVAARVRAAHERLLQSVEESVRAVHPKIDDQSVGRLERNLQLALARLVQTLGPGGALLDSNDEEHEYEIQATEMSLLGVVSKQLSPEIGRTAFLAFADFVRDPVNAGLLAVLGRTYATLVLRNLDPLGRRWQAAVLGRSIVNLDTDAVLVLAVSDHPSSSPLRTALTALAGIGAKVRVPTFVLKEAAGTIGRAGRTFNKFCDQLMRLPSATVDERVWHAVVQGFYYYMGADSDRAQRRDVGRQFDAYLGNLYDPEDPVGFLRHSLSSTLDFEEFDVSDPPEPEQSLATTLTSFVYELKERHRKKAQFRDPSEMRERVAIDVAFALDVSRRRVATTDSHRFLVSRDTAFRRMEDRRDWEGRDRVALDTRNLPLIADYLGKARLSDTDLVSLLFQPILGTAGELMAHEVSELARSGVDLASPDVSLVRLDWDLSKKLLQPQAKEESTVADRVALAIEANAAGYDLEPLIQQALEDKEASEKALAQ